MCDKIFLLPSQRAPKEERKKEKKERWNIASNINDSG